jgi:hypothetical protein
VGGGGGEGNREQKKKAFSSIFTTDKKTFIHVTRIAAMHIIFTRIGCTLFTCDMYMCRIRHINDPVLSSLKMEGIRLLFLRTVLSPSAVWVSVMGATRFSKTSLQFCQTKRKNFHERGFILIYHQNNSLSFNN